MLPGSEYVDEIEGGFCWAEVVVRLVVVDLGSALGAGVGAVAGVGIANADLGLEIDVAAEHPCVAVADAGAGIPTLVAIVAELAGVGTEQVPMAVEATDVVLTTHSVDGEEMSAELLAEPISGLRHSIPVLPAAAVGELPSVEFAGEVEGPSRSKSNLYSGVDI